MEDFEKQIVEIMINENCTFVQALHIIFDMHSVDKTSVFDLVDFLEEQVYNLDTVQYIMDIFVGNSPDLKLRPLNEKTNKS